MVSFEKYIEFHLILRGSVTATCQPHKLETENARLGANPSPAPKLKYECRNDYIITKSFQILSCFSCSYRTLVSTLAFQADK